MSFRPLNEGSSTALLGTADPSKFLDTYRDDIDKSYYERRLHGSEEKQNNIKYTLIIIVISAIIFVTVIAIYDIFRSLITNYFAQIALVDPNSHNSEEDIENTIIANDQSFWATFVFAIFCIVVAIILIYILVQFI